MVLKCLHYDIKMKYNTVPGNAAILLPHSEIAVTISHYYSTFITDIIVTTMSTTNMDDNNKNKKHTFLTLSPDTTGKGNEEDTKYKK